ncbi:hypothetical protein AAL_08092 [Moelleriella libera RCEF 2490]|uniref:Uncharacterized protein n=1 Tax=Moelleriella libera RCEF 2490 TaxID=1081109 RepID=A0A167W2K2_9HYPO|nr:hypothetical protein AAL_08092 [Moelleriella libera RCEF 2490]
MDYYIRKAVDQVKKRRRSQDEVAQETNVEEIHCALVADRPTWWNEPDLHLAAKNCVINVDPGRKSSVTSEDLERYNPSFG